MKLDLVIFYMTAFNNMI